VRINSVKAVGHRAPGQPEGSKFQAPNPEEASNFNIQDNHVRVAALGFECLKFPWSLFAV
jgi:hypothetical protein